MTRVDRELCQNWNHCLDGAFVRVCKAALGSLGQSTRRFDPVDLTHEVASRIAKAKNCAACIGFDRCVEKCFDGGGRRAACAYAFRVARNWLINQLERIGRQVLPGEEPAAPAELDPVTKARVRDAVLKLSPRQRAVVLLRDVLGWDWDFVARVVRRAESKSDDPRAWIRDAERVRKSAHKELRRLLDESEVPE